MSAVILASGAVLTGLAVTAANAQERFLIEGIADGEFYHTDRRSLLLSRNDGDLSPVGRIQLWSAYQLSETLQIYALGEFESDNSSGSYESMADLEQLAIRYTRQEAPFIVIEAGRILGPVSVFADWHLSTRNPLIGELYTHATTYPEGVQVTGSQGLFDYRAAFVDEPDYNLDFVAIDPGSAYRPVLGFGFTPVFGLRVGASYTDGPYLNSRLSAFLPKDSSWRDFDQRVVGLDFQFSRGYLELNGEWAEKDYEVPFRSGQFEDSRFFLELKYTFTPRFYAAGRYQSVDGVFLDTSPEGTWDARYREFTNLELGLGYRLAPHLLLKASYRSDHWRSTVDAQDEVPDGHSLALQLSFSLDPRSWVRHE